MCLRVFFVNNGSTYDTWPILKSYPFLSRTRALKHALEFKVVFKLVKSIHDAGMYMPYIFEIEMRSKHSFSNSDLM